MPLAPRRGSLITGTTSSGGGGGGSTAPDLVSATALPIFTLNSNATAFSFAGQINVSDTLTNWTNTNIISVVATGPSAPNGQEIARLHSPFTVVSHQVAYSGESGAFLQASVSETWSVRFTAYDTAGVPSPNPVVVSGIAVNPASVATCIASELLPRFQDPNQGIATRVSATITLTNGQVPQLVTFWLSRDNGTTKLLQGWTKATTSPATITLPYPKVKDQLGNYEGYYVPANGNETWVLYVASGPLTDLNPPAQAVASLPFVVPQIGPPSVNGVTAVSIVGPLSYVDGLGLPDWEIPSVSWTDPDITHPADQHYDINAWYTVLTFQCTDVNGNPAPGAAAGPGLDQGGDEVEVEQFPVLGAHPQVCNLIAGYGYNPPGSIYTYACLRIYTVNRLASGSQRFLDPVNAKAQACWGGGTRAQFNFGSVPNGGNLPAQPFAPNVTSPSAAVNYTTAGGLPVWNLNGNLTLPVPSTGIKRIHITAVGLDEVLAISSAQFGNAQFPLAGQVLSWSTSNFPRDTVTFNYTLQFWVENSDGILTGSPPSVLITVTGTAAPFQGNAPPAPSISTATVTANYQRYGHDFLVGFTVSFVAPTNSTGVHYSVRVSKVYSTGQRATIDTLNWDISGPFLAGLSYGFTSDPADPVPLVSQTWHIEFLPINPDNVATGALSIPVTVAPNLITAVIGSEGVQFIEPGGGAKTHINVTPTITTANAPGLSVALPQTVTFYFSADNGATWFGLDWVDLSASGLSVPFELWRPTDSAKTLCKVAVAIGAWNFPVGPFNGINTTGPILNSSLPTSVVQSPSVFTLALVGAPLAGDCTGGFVNPLTGTVYNQVVTGTTAAGDIYWGLPDGIGFTVPAKTTDPNFWYASLTAQCVDVNGNPAPNAMLGGVEKEVQRFDNASPGTVTCFIVNGWEFNPAGSVYEYMRFRVRAVSRSAVNGFKDPTFATLQTICWSGTDHRDIHFGQPPATSIIAGPAPVAPSPASVSVPTIRSTSASTLPAILGLPVWNADLLITLDSSNGGTHTKALNISIPGYSDFLVRSFTPNGSHQVTITIPTEYQDTVTHTLTASVTAVNEDGVPSAAVTTSILVPSATSPISGGAAPAPSFAGLVSGTTLGVGGCTVAVSPYYQKYGREWLVGFNTGFIAPATGQYAVQVNKLYPDGSRGNITTWPGPFTSGTQYTTKSDASDPLIVGNWTIEFLPYNGDNVPAAVKQVTVAVANNIVAGVTGSEGAQFIEGGGGAKTHVNIVPTITSVNAPGLSSTAPQAITCYFSADGGVTYFWLGWVDVSSSGSTQTFELWRPTDQPKSCKVAVCIGAQAGVGDTSFNGINTTGPIPAGSLPAGTVVSASVFALVVITPPLSSDCTSGFVNSLTGTVYNQVVIAKTAAGDVYWGLPDGIGFTMPARGADSNLFYATLTAQCVDASGNPAPNATLGGVEKEVQRFDNLSSGVVTCFIVNGWEFNPSGSPYQYMRFRVRAVSRAAVNGFKDPVNSVLQSSCWGGSDHRDVFFGPPPATSIIATLTSANSGTGTTVDGSGHINVNIAGSASNLIANPGFESGVTSWQSQFATPIANSIDQRTGSGCCQINPGTYCLQEVTLGVGVSVQLSGYVKTPSGNGQIQLFLRFEDGSNNVLSSTTLNFNPTTSYQQMVVSLTSVAGTVKAAFGWFYSSGVGYWVIDDTNMVVLGGATGTVGIDGSGNLQVPPLSLQSTNLAAQSLSDLSKYSTTVRAVAIVFGEPSGVPNATYPAGSIIFDVSAGTYKAQVGSGWKAAARATDIIAGALVSGVTYTGVLNANQVNAGTFNGCSLTLNANSVTTTITNQFDNGGNGFAGMICTANGLPPSGGWRSVVEPLGFHCIGGDGISVLNVMSQPKTGGYYGHLVLGDSSGLGGTIRADANTPTLVVFGTSGTFPNITVQDSVGNSIQITSTGIFRNGLPYTFP